MTPYVDGGVKRYEDATKYYADKSAQFIEKIGKDKVEKVTTTATIKVKEVQQTIYFKKVVQMVRTTSEKILGTKRTVSIESKIGSYIPESLKVSVLDTVPARITSESKRK